MVIRARLALLLCAAVALSGCYLLHTARGQWEVMSKRREIPTVIADPRTTPPVRERLQAVMEIRAFAVEVLGLPDNGSYRSYADLERPYVVWNVFATPEFSVEPKQWCFPITGCVAYRGYFSAEKADNFAARLKRQGFDTAVTGVTAYSTLGHFADPVLNTMMGWSEVQLAAILFHELAHQLLYIPGDSKFNEAFATVVEEEGVARWLARTGREAELAAYLQRKARYFEFSALLRATRERLRRWYASGAPPAQMRVGKQKILLELKESYQELKASWNGDGPFDAWFSLDLNNAHLASIATYQDCVPGLEKVLREEAQGDLARFYPLARALAKLETQVRREQLCSVSHRKRAV